MYVCLNRGTTGGSLSLEEFVALSAGAGFAGCDVDFGYAEQHGLEKLKDLYAKHKQKFGGWGTPLNQNTESAKRAEAAKTLERHAAHAAKVGADSCCMWMLPSSKLPFQENWKLHVDALKPAAKILADHGLRLGLEFVSPYHLRRQNPHEFIYTPGLMLELADAIGPNAGLLIDCWHMHHSATPMSQIAQIPAKRIVLGHLNDSPQLPPEEILDSRRLLPGEGVIDLAGFFRNMQEAGYTGPVSLEAFHVVKDLPPKEAAAKAWTACKKVLTEIGMA
ncbi:MAG TPA: sugar phosphate isomerase/epimerase family protein [Tepidisphaeraceae bacterium]|jgi:sugar phosphate isomerase/epimerase|nr:sugar phosphate isomerase/epimerase family protein [Tepidisphaeraceae bacterium]